MPIFQNFITLEGLDFCGKSTQVKKLVERLEAQDISVFLLREPGGTSISEQIRQILLDNKNQEMHDRSEILLYSAARAQMVHQVLLPLLEKNRDGGGYVVADRFFDSTTAYQGFGRQLDIDFVKQLNTFATSAALPYKTLLLDISPEESFRRRRLAGRGRDRIESADLEFYERIRNGYLQLAQEDPNRFIQIDAEDEIEAVAAKIWDVVSEIWQI